MALMLGMDFKSSSTKGLGWQSPHDDDGRSRCSGALPLFLPRCLLAAYATRCVLVMGNLASVKFRGRHGVALAVCYFQPQWRHSSAT